MLENVDMIGRHFPDWKVYIYTAPDVEPGFLTQVAMYSNVIVKPTGKLGAVNMIERFFAIDEPDVEVMLVRDADSRVHWRDRWAIRDFMSRPQFSVHAIRDHPHHISNLMGGLWGMRKIPGFSISKQYEQFTQNPVDRGFGHDQSFLCTSIFPHIQNFTLVHIGGNVPIYNEETAIKFPFPYSASFHCGHTEGLGFNDVPEPKYVMYSFLKTRR